MKQQNRLSQTELSDRELKNRQMASVISILVGVFAISLGWFPELHQTGKCGSG